MVRLGEGREGDWSGHFVLLHPPVPPVFGRFYIQFSSQFSTLLNVSINVMFCGGGGGGGGRGNIM